jgi:probable HAF family extracellular repeat protein
MCSRLARGFRSTPAAASFPVLILAIPAAWATPPRYTVRVVEPPPALPSTFPTDINASGAISGYAADEQFSPTAAPIMVTGDGQLIPLASGDQYNFALGLNDYHYVVGVSTFQPVLWIGDSGTPIPITPGFGSGSAIDINVAARVVGSVGDTDFIGPQHCVWLNTSEPAVILSGLFENNTSGSAWAVNESGQIAGVTGAQVGNFVACRWDAVDATPLQIGPLPGAFNSEGLGMNEHGDVVGRSSFESGTIEAFLYIDETSTLLGLGFLPGGGAYSLAWGVNDQRQVVGDANLNNQSRAFLWHQGTMYDLNDLLIDGDSQISYLWSAVGINNAGQIAAAAFVTEGPNPPTAIALLTPVPPGDLDGDGDVDINDLTLLLSQYGCQADCTADLDGDGDVDLNDLTILLSNYGSHP